MKKTQINVIIILILAIIGVVLFLLLIVGAGEGGVDIITSLNETLNNMF